MRKWGLICVALLSVTIATVAASADPAPYLGVYSEVNENPPGLRIQLSPGSPAAEAGLRNGDVILGIDNVMFADSETPFAEQLTAAIAAHKIGDTITIHVYRDAPEMTLSKNGELVDTPWPRDEFDSAVEQSAFSDTVTLQSEKLEQYIDLEATLGPRPDTLGVAFKPNAELMPDLQDGNPALRQLLEDLVAAADGKAESQVVVGGDNPRNVGADSADLYQRLDARATPDDGYRFEPVVVLLREGLLSEAATRRVSAVVCSSVAQGSLPDLTAPEASEVTGEGSGLDFIKSRLGRAVQSVSRSFTALDGQQLDFIKSQRTVLSNVFSHMHYVDSEDPDQRRAAANAELVELGGKLNPEGLEQALSLLSFSADELGVLQQELQDLYRGQESTEILYEEQTEYGRIVITGTGESWFTGPQPALHIDLGGDDLYTYTEGGGSSLDTPVGVIIDLGGNDAYESTTPFCQGSGSMGVSLLVDVEGDDSYIGLQWAQGCGFFGCGALIDMAGNDTYRGEEFCQAAAIFGTGLLIDYAGDDRFEAQMKSQGFGGSGAVGLLIDVAGDDYRYAKGKYPTGYGDPGIFDAWSQGCAMGFRGLASGGIAGVIDMAGSDYNEAGNFSQGGGYYFGYGFFHDMGWEDDVYIGSRYNQGFSAHQAVGCFLEDGGNDRYITRQAVAQGLAWDECVTMFIDYGGDDYYDGGTGFSQGASAHNSMCIFWDVDGRDTYVYPPGQARAGGNEYHGGTSLSLFIDSGGAVDWYDCPQSGNNLVTGWPEHGFFADLPGTLEAAVADGGWKSLWRSQ